MKKITASFISAITATCLLCTLLPQHVNAQITIEDFEVVDSVTFSGSSITPWTQTSQVQTSGTYSITTSVDSLGTKFMTTDPINTNGLMSLLLKFNQICRVHFFDGAVIEVSNDGGFVFSKLTESEFLASNTDWWAFAGQASTFTSAISMDWDPGVAVTVATNAMWHSAEFDLTPLLPAPSLIIRFRLEDRNNNGSEGYPGWYIDDVELLQQYFSLNHNSGVLNQDTCSIPNTYNFIATGYAIGFAPTDSINVHAYFGDGSDSIFRLPIVNNMFNTPFSHAYTAPGNYTTNIVVNSPAGVSDSIVKGVQIVSNANCGSIAGHIFEDANGNCQFDNGEIGAPYLKVDLYNNNVLMQVQFADYTGKYVFYNVPNTGNYTVEFDSSYNSSATWYFTCPASGVYAIPSVPSLNNDFAVTCNSGFDLWTQFRGGFSPLLGTTGRIELYNVNLSCSSQNATSKLVLDPRTTFAFASIPPQAISGDTLIWYNVINGSGYFHTNVSFLADSTLTIGDTVCFTSIVEPMAGDLDPTNNILTQCAPFNSSFDPNNKTVTPEGNIPPGQKLSYVVNFQNTGTATAQNIYVLDTLDANLDLFSLKIITASHNARYYVLQGNVLKAEFPNIMLPDSNANEALSHGFFSYSINAKPGLQNGTTIENTAHIYFDYNAPISTNTTVNTIQTTVGIAELSKAQTAVIYPNPFSNEFSISSSENIKAVYLRSITGEQILERKINDKSAKINVQNLPAGIYPLSVETDKGITIYKLVKL